MNRVKGTAAQRRTDEGQLGDRVFHVLRWSLIIGEFEPGDTISTRAVAAAHGISAMPAREALKRLESDGALSGAPKRAYRVPELPPSRAADLFQVQSVLEGAAAEAAAAHLPARQIQRLRELTQEMHEAMVAEDARSYLSANYSFHFIIYSGSGNAELAAIVEALYPRTGPWLARAIRRFARIEDWQNEHMKIADALAARDGPAARRLIEADILWNCDIYRRVMA